MHENLKKKGLVMDGNQASLKVKRVETSRYLDQTQAYYTLRVYFSDHRAFVKAWNNAETRGYYSRLWSKEDLRDKPKK